MFGLRAMDMSLGRHLEFLRHGTIGNPNMVRS